jgi:hypothetical protein
MLWNVATQQELLSYEHPGGSPGAGLLFSPDGRLLIGPETPGPGASASRFYRALSWEEIASSR